MFQLEVKAALVEVLFPPSAGWLVTVDIDAMERGHGSSQSDEKRQRAAAAEARLLRLGATIGKHRQFGRADVVADHPEAGTVVVEVEGSSSRQREQAMYSALGQTILMMRSFDDGVRYAIAVPDEESWLRQLHKIPRSVTERLRLHLFAVREGSVREIVAS